MEPVELNAEWAESDAMGFVHRPDPETGEPLYMFIAGRRRVAVLTCLDGSTLPGIVMDEEELEKMAFEILESLNQKRHAEAVAQHPTAKLHIPTLHGWN